MTHKQQLIAKCQEMGIPCVSRDTIPSLQTKVRKYLIDNPNPGFWDCINRKLAKLTRLLQRQQKPRKAHRLTQAILNIIEDHYGDMKDEFLARHTQFLSMESVTNILA